AVHVVELSRSSLALETERRLRPGQSFDVTLCDEAGEPIAPRLEIVRLEPSVFGRHPAIGRITPLGADDRPARHRVHAPPLPHAAASPRRARGAGPELGRDPRRPRRRPPLRLPPPAPPHLNGLSGRALSGRDEGGVRLARSASPTPTEEAAAGDAAFRGSVGR